MALPTAILVSATVALALVAATFASADSAGSADRLPRTRRQTLVPIFTINEERPQNYYAPFSWNNRRLSTRTSRQSFLNELSQISPANRAAFETDFDQLMTINLRSDEDAAAAAADQTDELSLLYAPTTGTKGGATKGLGGRLPAKGVSPATAVRRSGFRPQAPAFGFPVESGVSVGSRPNISMAPTTTTRAGQRKNLVCYYGTWAVYRPDGGKYPVENIDPFLCTHLIYGFTGLSFDNLIKPLDPWNDLEDNYGKGAMKRFTNLKRINPDLKTLVAIGGWNEGSIKYSKMASEPEARSRFVASVVDFLQKYNFDGLDLDWEYPGSRGGASYDKQNFVHLLRELHNAFEPHNYLLTAAVSAGKWFIDPAYDIAQVSRYLDLINLMAYDYHGGWETKTGMNAPLFASKRHDLGKDDALLNVNWSVNYWLQSGAAREKIMLGVGSYGRSFTLDKASVNGINAPASQKGQAGPYTREPGSLGYNEICEAFQRQPNSWTIVRDPDYLAPYAYNDRQWVGYDDQQSLALKAQFAKSMGLGGMMMWSIETDDFQGRCHGEKYPLLNTIRRVLDGAGPDVVVQPARPATPAPGGGRVPTSSSTTTTTTRRPPSPVTPGHEVEEEQENDRPTRRPPQQQTTSTTTTTRRPTTARPQRPRPPPPAPSSTRRPAPQSTRPPQPPATGGGGSRPSGEFVCRADGMFADPQNCRKFIRCVSSGGSQHFAMYKFDCGPGTAFNEQQQYCDHIYNVPSCSASAANRVKLVGARQLRNEPSQKGASREVAASSLMLSAPQVYYPPQQAQLVFGHLPPLAGWR